MVNNIELVSPLRIGLWDHLPKGLFMAYLTTLHKTLVRKEKNPMIPTLSQTKTLGISGVILLPTQTTHYCKGKSLKPTIDLPCLISLQKKVAFNDPWTKSQLFHQKVVKYLNIPGSRLFFATIF